MRLAKKLGAAVEVNSEAPMLDVGVEAPKGKVWTCDGGDLHELIGSQWDEEPVGNVWDDLYFRMEYGLRDESEPSEWWN